MLNSFTSLIQQSEVAELEAALRNHPRRAIRLRDDFHASALPFETNPVPWNRDGLFVHDAELRPGGFLEYPACCYYIQDAGSLLPISLLDPQPGEVICDLCAAPGGKSTAILERMQGRGVLIANEPIRSRTNVLKYMLGRTGLPNYLTTELDPDQMAIEFDGEFDAVLVDAPCSGQMMVSRDKRDANAWSTRQIEHSAARQQRILDAAVRLLRPGGRIVYSTCTFALEENELQIARILEQYPSEIMPLRREELSLWESPAQTGCYRLWPHRDFCAGGFAGGFVMKQGIEFKDVRVNHLRDTKIRQKDSTKTTPHGRSQKKMVTDPAEEFVSIGEVVSAQIRTIGDSAYLGTDEVWGVFDSHRNVAHPPLIMVQSTRRIEPSHTLALLRKDWFRSLSSITLNDSQAMGFLTGESLRGLEQSGSTPWTQVMWKGKPIGWGRFSQNQLKNHLPAWARFSGLNPSQG